VLYVELFKGKWVVYQRLAVQEILVLRFKFTLFYHFDLTTFLSTFDPRVLLISELLFHMSIKRLGCLYILPSYFLLCLDVRYRGRLLDLDLVFFYKHCKEIKYSLTKKVLWTFVTTVFYFHQRELFIEVG